VDTDISQEFTVPIFKVLLFHYQVSVYIYRFPIQATYFTHCYF